MRLNRIVAAAKRLGQGNLDTKTGLIGTSGELGELANAFDSMASALRLTYAEIELRIINRTQELANTNKLLQAEIIERKLAYHEIDQFLSAISVILIGVDGEGKVKHWSNAARLAFGISLDAVTGREFVRLPLAWDWEEVTKGIIVCRKNNQSVKLSNIWYERIDGADGFLVVSISPLSDDASDLSGYLLLGDDITDVRFLEAQLAQAAKLEAIGQLAAGIAHEINTPTQYVGDSVTFLKNAYEDLSRVLAQSEDLSSYPSPCGQAVAASISSLLEEIDASFLKEEIPKTITRIYVGIEQISSIVRAMKRFSYTSGDEKKSVDIRNALENTLVISRNEWKYVAETKTDFDPELTDVTCLAGEINQLFLNVIINAAHAIGDVVRETNSLGLISISTKKDGDFAVIRIKDTGTGIPKELGSKVFNLFFTTKEVGKGTGQGLAIAYDIVVNKHGGGITFESEPGQGTTFIIRLPIAG